MRGLAGPLVVAISSQVAAAVLDGAVRWATVAAIGLAVYHVWRQKRWEGEEQQRIEEIAALTRPAPMRAEWWPKDW